MDLTSVDDHDTTLWVPDSARAEIVKQRAANVMIDNRTDLPDEALQSYFVENTAMFGFGRDTNYLSYQAEGTMMARSKWAPPRNVVEEMVLARDLAERDDDVAPAIATMIAAAFHGGVRNQHEDEQVEHTFEEMAEDVGLLQVLREMYRELLITGQVTTVTVFVRETYDLRPENVTRMIKRSMAAPLIGVLPGERVRVLGNDLFGNGPLGYVPDGKLGIWLHEFFNQSTSSARKREMRMQDPLAAALFVAQVPTNLMDMETMSFGATVFVLNPDMVRRSTFPKGAWRYPRPLLTRDFSLLEAKRLLNVLDHALLQGGVNYIVVAKKGDEKKPATGPELQNLQSLVQRAARSGVLIGDHRINLEIIQPDMAQMLHPDKRRMIGRKLAGAMLRVPEFGSDETGAAVQTFTELVQAVITDDRNIVIGHLHRFIWRECMKRNTSVFNRSDRPLIWAPKVVLQGLDFWTQYLLKLYDRGDLPRKYMVEFGGYDYPSVMAQKQREVEGGHDLIFAPPQVPYSAPGQSNNPMQDPSNPYHYGNPSGGPGPQDNGPGRPRGARTDRTAPGLARPSRVIRRTPGETVRAYWSDEQNEVVRIGQITERVLGEYPDATIGRITAAERSALEAQSTTNAGNVIVVPVNQGYEVDDVRAVRLGDEFSLLCGNRIPDGAIVAVAFCFREPGFTVHQAEDMVLRWGFQIGVVQADAQTEDMLTCPQCGCDCEMTADSCPECNFAGPPFTLPPDARKNLGTPGAQPIALTVNINGQEVKTGETNDPPVPAN